MKCKAVWSTRYKEWILHCAECKMTIVHAYNEVSPPHDMAVTHAQRYHKG